MRSDHAEFQGDQHDAVDLAPQCRQLENAGDLVMEMTKLKQNYVLRSLLTRQYAKLS